MFYDFIPIGLVLMGIRNKYPGLLVFWRIKAAFELLYRDGNISIRSKNVGIPQLLLLLQCLPVHEYLSVLGNFSVGIFCLILQRPHTLLSEAHSHF